MKVAPKQLKLLTGKLKDIEMSVNALEDDDGICALEEYRDQEGEIKEWNGVKTFLLKSDVASDDSIMQDQTQADKLAFDCLVLIKKRLRSNTASKTTSSEAIATKLPKLELPTFHGDILWWKNFWEQFCVSVRAVEYTQGKVNVSTERHQVQNSEECD